MSAGLQRPLGGIRVVDQCDEKGEVAGRILADLGAEVVRIEPPGGAPSRRIPPFHTDTSLFFTVRNLGKKSQSIDLKRAEGRERLEQLLAAADVWLESHPPLMLAPLNLDPRSVIERHPRLVITSITDFGQNGPYRDYQATDAIILAMSG